MCHLADNTAMLLQVGKDRYVGWPVIPMDDRPAGKNMNF